MVLDSNLDCEVTALTEITRVILSSCRRNLKYYLPTGHDHFIPNSQIYPIIRRCVVSVLTAALINLQKKILISPGSFHPVGLVQWCLVLSAQAPYGSPANGFR
jgi:hypothetical protein